MTQKTDAISSRRTARDDAYKLIFGYLFNKEIDEQTRAMMLADETLSDDDVKYLNQVTDGVVEKYDELIDVVCQNAKNFKPDRIYKPDLAALLLAIYEMKYIDYIPPRVSISETVELVKIYSTEKSYVFVNGVLSGVYKQLTQE
ncbi:MAG: transcription antitermination factor NusB [Christensenellales bacterium]